MCKINGACVAQSMIGNVLFKMHADKVEQINFEMSSLLGDMRNSVIMFYLLNYL